MSLKRTKRYKLKAWGGVLAVLALAAAGIFVLPKFIGADGALVSSFGTGGVVTSNTVGDVENRIYDMAIDANYLYAIGFDEETTNSREEWRIEKRNLSDGALVTGFGIGGVLQIDHVAGRDERPRGIVIDGSFMYVIGWYMPLSNVTFDWVVEKRRLSDGALCTAANCGTEFGTGGIIATNPSSRFDPLYAVAIDPTGQYLFMAGYDYVISGSNPRIRIEKRRLSDGALCTAANCGTEFGTGGVKTDSITGVDGLNKVAVDSTGLYTAGFQKPSETHWRIEKRNLDTGAVIWSQDVSPSSNAYWEEAGNIIVDGTGVYITGDDRSQFGGNHQWRIEKRNLSDGSLVSSFDGDGVLTENPSAGNDRARGLATDADSLYIAGNDISPGNSQWRMERRNKSDGSLIWVQTTNPSLLFTKTEERTEVVKIDSGGNAYFAGSDGSLPNVATYRWRIEKRRTAAPVSAPTVTTQSATSITSSGAVLNGLANPNNASTTGWFRYDAAIPPSCNDTFGTRVPSSGGTSLGSGSTAISFSQSIGGLNPSSTYYFCAIAENSAGKSYGSVQSFTTSAVPVTSAYGVTREGCDLKNWGWGDQVAGWISFNSSNNYTGKTSGASYGAHMTNFCQNVSPNAPTGLSGTDTSSANWSFNCVSPLQPTFSWTFSDPNTDDSQKAYQVQVDNNADFTSPEYDTGSVTSTSLTTTVPSGILSYNTAYNWRVKTWDNRKTPKNSPWTTGSPFTTTAHAWPEPDFTFTPQMPSIGQDVLFRRDQDSDGSGFGTRCFDATNAVTPCANYYWTMQDSDPAMSDTPSSSIPVIVKFTSAGTKQATLRAQDPDGFYCFKTRLTGSVTLPLPEFREVLPR